MGEIMMTWSIPHSQNLLAFLNWWVEKSEPRQQASVC